MPDAGYSGTPLPQKLGLRDGQRVLFIGLPEAQAGLATSRAFAEARQTDWPGLGAEPGGRDVIHGFTSSRQVLADAVLPLKARIKPDGAIWISWPKKASRVATDISEDVVREVALPIGLVDVKVAAVDEIWSGLKLVIRKELR